MGNNPDNSDMNANDANAREATVFPRTPKQESRQVKGTLLNVLKSSHKGTLKEVFDVRAPSPILHAPNKEDLPRKIVSSSTQTEMLTTLVQSYDRAFFKGQAEYAGELIKKHRFIDQMGSDNFSKQILFAYCYPKEKHLNRAAKKFAHQAMKRSLALLTQNNARAIEHYGADTIVGCHRDELKGMIEYALQRNYIALFRKNISLLDEKEQTILTNMLFHPEMKSYLNPKTKELFYQLEQKAANEARKSHGAPIDYEIQIHACHAPNEVSEWIFTEAINWRHLLQDHLYFYQTYLSQLDKQYPPLLLEEKQLLLEYAVHREGVLSESLKTTHDICNRESRAMTVAKFTDLQSSWNYEPHILALALEKAKAIENGIMGNQDISQKDSELLLRCLRDRSYCTELIQVPLKKLFDKLLDSSINCPEENEGSIKLLNKAKDNAYFLLQLEQELGPMHDKELQKLISSASEGQDGESERSRTIVNKCIAQTRNAKSLPADWKPSIKAMKAITNVESQSIAYQKLNIQYLKDFHDACVDAAELFDEKSPLKKSLYAITTFLSETEKEAAEQLCLNLATHPQAFPSLCESYREKQRDESSQISPVMAKKLQFLKEDTSNREALRLFEIIDDVIGPALQPSYSAIFTPRLLGASHRKFIEESLSCLNDYFGHIYFHALSVDTKKEISAAVVYARQAFYGYLLGIAPEPTLISKLSEFIEKLVFERCGSCYEAKIAGFASIELLENMLFIGSTALVLLKSGITPVEEVSSSHDAGYKHEKLPHEHEAIMDTVRNHWIKDKQTPLLNSTLQSLSKGIAKEADILADTLSAIYELPNEFHETLVNKIKSTVNDLNELLALHSHDDSLLHSLKALAKRLYIGQTEETIKKGGNTPSSCAFRQFFAGPSLCLPTSAAVDPEKETLKMPSTLFCTPERNMPASIASLCSWFVPYVANLELLKTNTKESSHKAESYIYASTG